MDSRAPPTSWSRCHRPEIFGGSSPTRAAREWSSPARRRPRAGQDANSENNGRMHPDGFSKVAIYPRPFARGSSRHPHLQPANRGVHHQAQLDRFMLKLNIGYPQKSEERNILDLMATSAPDLRVDPVVDPKQIIASRDVVNSIYIDDRVKDYIVDVVWATRDPAAYNLRLEGLIRYGASPRATIYLALGARAHAFLNGRGYVTPQDVKSIGPDVLRHRIIVSYEAEAEAVTSETIIERIFAGLPVP